MKKSSFMRIFRLLLAAMLIAAMAASLAGCNLIKLNMESPSSIPDTQAASNTETPSSIYDVQSVPNEVGTGEKMFSFVCVDGDGNQKCCSVHTDAETVGEALIENGIIEGENGPYGMYVKSVFGIIADYDKTKTYWAFYINGEYAMQGVEKTEVTIGETYEFRIQK